MNVTVRRKIVCNGKEYSDPSELPEPFREAFAKALSEHGGLGGLTTARSTKIVVNGREFGRVEEVPEALRKIVEGALDAAETSGSAPGDAAERDAQPHQEDPAVAASGAPIEPRSSAAPWRLLVTAAGLALFFLWLLRVAARSR